MAYWGEALAFSQPLWFFEEPEKARAALGGSDRAPRGAAGEGRHRGGSGGFLRAVEALWGPGVRGRCGPRRSPSAMAAVATANPGDDEAQVFYALALLGTLARGDASLPLREKAGALAEAVFARNPKHPGAARLILHAYNHGALAPRGLAAARASSSTAHSVDGRVSTFEPNGVADRARGDEFEVSGGRSRVTAYGLLEVIVERPVTRLGAGLVADHVCGPEVDP